MIDANAQLILARIADVKSEVAAAEGRVRDEIAAVEARLFEQLDELKRDRDAIESEVSGLKLTLAAQGQGSSTLKRDAALVGGTGALVPALLALIQWLTSAPPPRAERPHRDRPVVVAPAPEVPRAP